jgi:hypothetical protein
LSLVSPFMLLIRLELTNILCTSRYQLTCDLRLTQFQNQLMEACLVFNSNYLFYVGFFPIRKGSYFTIHSTAFFPRYVKENSRCSAHQGQRACYRAGVSRHYNNNNNKKTGLVQRLS